MAICLITFILRNTDEAIAGVEGNVFTMERLKLVSALSEQIHWQKYNQHIC